MPGGRAELRRGAALRRRDLPRAQEDPQEARATTPPSATRAASRRSLKSNEEACELIVEAIEAAGYKPGQGHRHRARPRRQLVLRGRQVPPTTSPSRARATRRSDEMIELCQAVGRRSTPSSRIEDGLAEDDWDGFQRSHGGARRARSRSSATTSSSPTPSSSRAASRRRPANAVLIKLNQIGTVTETIAAIDLCRKAGWGYVISHRSGETEDTFIADFAVAMGGGQIKTGSACRTRAHRQVQPAAARSRTSWVTRPSSRTRSKHSGPLKERRQASAAAPYGDLSSARRLRSIARLTRRPNRPGRMAGPQGSWCRHGREIRHGCFAFALSSTILARFMHACTLAFPDLEPVAESPRRP